jgi:hypothetical protein
LPLNVIADCILIKSYYGDIGIIPSKNLTRGCMIILLLRTKAVYTQSRTPMMRRNHRRFLDLKKNVGKFAFLTFEYVIFM